MEVRKDVAVGQAVTFSAQAAAQKLLLNNQDKLTISPELTRKSSFVVLISKEKINGAGGNISDQKIISLYSVKQISGENFREILE